MLVLLAMASLLSAPTPTNLGRWLGPNDTPIDQLQEGVATLVLTRLAVTSAGRVYDCRVEASNGNERLRDQTCELAMRRARFKPAKDVTGKPAYGVYRTVVTWILDPTSKLMPLFSDVELTVARLPANIESPASVRVMFAVDEKGTKSSCTGDLDEKHPQLIPTACKELLNGYSAIPAKDETGEPVPSIQIATVAFIVR